jgi:hypothetical protein
MSIPRRRTASLLLCAGGLIALFLLTTRGALAADTPARTETLAAGPYIVDVGIDQDPPFVDRPLVVTVTPHERSLQLQGQVIVRPGLGVDGVDLPTKLTSDASNILHATVHIPVRGAWHIIVALDGPQGRGSASLDVVVAAPGAIPTWLGWLIAMTPMVIIAWWLWRQVLYRRSLLAEPQT